MTEHIDHTETIELSTAICEKADGSPVLIDLLSEKFEAGLLGDSARMLRYCKQGPRGVALLQVLDYLGDSGFDDPVVTHAFPN